MTTSLRVHGIHNLWTELCLLSSALTESEFTWLGSDSENITWTKALDATTQESFPLASDSGSTQQLQFVEFSIALADPEQAHIVLQGSTEPLYGPGNDGVININLSLSAPAFTLPHTERAEWIAQLRSELFTQGEALTESYVEVSPSQLPADLNTDLSIPTIPIDDDLGCQLFNLYTLLKDWTTTNPVPPPSTGTPDNAQGTDPSAIQDDEMKSFDPSALRIHMYRQIFWTHHLLSKEKQRELSSWADELGVWLVVKVGYPGFLILEGPKAGLTQSSTTDSKAPAPDVSASSAGAGTLELSRRIRAMQWAKLTTKTRTEWTWTASNDSTLHTLRKPELSTAQSTALLACPLARACCHPLNQQNGVFVSAPPLLPSEDPTNDGPSSTGPKKSKRSSRGVSSPTTVGAVSVADYVTAWDRYTCDTVNGASKIRTGMVKTESVRDLVLLLRRTGLSETEILGGLGVRGAQGS